MANLLDSTDKDIFSGMSLTMSDLLLKSPNLLPNSLALSSPKFDTISQFLKSSQVDFSFDTLSANLSKGVADEISNYLRDKSEDGSISPLGGSLKWSAFLGKNLNLDDIKIESPDRSQPSLSPTPPVPTTKNDQLVPPNNNVASPSSALSVPKTEQQQTHVPKRKASISGEPEVKNPKKKRQEKNREAAQLFRQRQKTKVNELENKMDALIGVNNSYRMQIDSLFSENKMLQEQLLYWKNVVSSGILITRVPNYSSPETPEARQTVMEEFKRIAENLPPKFAAPVVVPQ